MTITGDVKQRIEAYLSTLQGRLRGASDAEVREIVEELRSHIIDKAAASGEATAAGVDAALAALGSPEELADEYMTDNLLARAEASRSPVRIMESLFRWASLSVAGFFVLVGSMVGYYLGTVFLLVAALKPFHPQTAGLWLLRGSTGDSEISLRLGFGSVPAGGMDILGWWIVPIGLLAGCAVVMLTTRFALWCARQYRRSHLLPRS
jgi:HAAS